MRNFQQIHIETFLKKFLIDTVKNIWRDYCKRKFGRRGAHLKNLWGGGVGHSGPTFYKNSFAKASCHRCTDLYFYHPG